MTSQRRLKLHIKWIGFILNDKKYYLIECMAYYKLKLEEIHDLNYS